MKLSGQAEAAGWAEAGALRPGMSLGRYELLVPVGAGGMARVWAARLRGYGGFSKLVAIKTVLPHLANQPELQTMLFDEARVAAQAHHPNVCNVLDVGEENGVTYAVLEWVDGDSLLRIVRSGGAALDVAVAARIVAEACAGLHAAHELVDEAGVLLGVVHRDVSPHNVLLSVDGTTKITDFGVAKARGQLHQTTRAGELRGKVAYMAPEQIQGGSPIDRRADVFALGSVLFFATTGHPPFRGENDVQIIRAVLEGRFDPPSALVADYPSDLEAIILKAMSSAPVDRYATAEAMRLALDAWASASGRQASPSDVADVVRGRIGTKLAMQREQLRTAIHAFREASTRPVRASRPPESGSSGLAHRALLAKADPGSQLAIAMPTPVSTPHPELSAAPTPWSATPASLARETTLKTAIAVGVGLLSAGGLLFARALVSAQPARGSLDRQSSPDRAVATQSADPPGGSAALSTTPTHEAEPVAAIVRSAVSAASSAVPSAGFASAPSAKPPGAPVKPRGALLRPRPNAASSAAASTTEAPSAPVHSAAAAPGSVAPATADIPANPY